MQKFANRSYWAKSFFGMPYVMMTDNWVLTDAVGMKIEVVRGQFSCVLTMLTLPVLPFCRKKKK